MKLLKIAALALAMTVLAKVPAAQAQQTPADQARVAYATQSSHAFADLRPLGIGMVIMGASIGIGWLARSAVESMARQPEIAGNAQIAMIISAALIEGVTFFALIILMLFAYPY